MPHVTGLELDKGKAHRDAATFKSTQQFSDAITVKDIQEVGAVFGEYFSNPSDVVQLASMPEEDRNKAIGEKSMEAFAFLPTKEKEIVLPLIKTDTGWMYDPEADAILSTMFQ